jgi:Na+-translocating ferredoxin:NAD+ oxidoreductase RnfA subunit
MNKLKWVLTSILFISFLCGLGFVSFIEGFMSEFAVGKNLPWYFYFLGVFPLLITHGFILAIVLKEDK